MTFSIVARDPDSGSFGVATATGGPVVGSLVPHVRAGVGAIATQGHTTNPFYGPEGLNRLTANEPGPTVVRNLVEADPQSNLRQLLVIDRDGNAEAWTGTGCGPWAGSIVDKNAAVAGNLLTGKEVLHGMMDAYQGGIALSFEERLINAMLIGYRRGGDLRGVWSAAVKICSVEFYPTVDIRVDWSREAIADLSVVLAQVRKGDYAAFFARLPRLGTKL